jgi:PadR family transcriptional regulator PadR
VLTTREDSTDQTGCCDMRGMLSFQILWLLSKRSMYGQELATEIGKRRGEKPSCGTIYPALKDLETRGIIKAHSEGHNNVYELTQEGWAGLPKALEWFKKAFGDIVTEDIPKASSKKKVATKL